MRSPIQRPPRRGRQERASRLAVDALAQFHTGLQRYLVRRLRGTQDVEDLAQEVYLRLLRVGGKEPVKYPQAYVYRVAFNVLYEFKFHKKHNLITFDSETLANAVDGLEDDAASPDELYEHGDLKRRLTAAVTQLSAMQRAVFLLAKHQNLSHAQIAERLGISVNTVRVHLHRAICHCRQVLRDHVDKGNPEKGQSR